ncbi:uncharacterized protein LOC110687600 [Chenopodium quinoa]|uniref:Radical S-adenosyl methionine domain-containing protein 1, mitochondrial n=1 Tax=Chenopodium quinoa TaxID=63459 RepID=A0A803KQH0_CHEQI|nr:uncharacterized protein LOC110687600 [Chenopodium quinoa]
MLRIALSPFISSFHLKFKGPNFSLTVRNVHTQCTSTVRQNAQTNPTPLYQLPPTSAYIHLPFCRKRCHYCDFPIVALGSSMNQSHDDDPRIIDYIELICREIKATRLDFDQYPPLKTVFFGGGTPSLVPPRLVALVLDTLKSKFGVCLNAEISMEMDPGTFNADKLRDFLGLGVNRVSLGVQAFQEELLKACGRAHGLKEVYEAIEIVESCRVGNWSMDLISSLPHQTTDMWSESLQLTIDAKPTHVSVYDLQVEKDTKFGVLYTPGELPLPSESQSAEFYKMASEALTSAGYEHYEISSYSKSGFKCQHNLTYWKNTSFYGFGLGSASYLNGLRFSRPRRMRDYATYVANLENGLASDQESGNVDPKDRAADIVMLSLRTSRGLDIKSFTQDLGASLALSLCQAYKPYVESGHVLCLDEERKLIPASEVSSLFVGVDKLEERVSFIRLSDPEGFLLSNEFISIAFGVVAP